MTIFNRVLKNDNSPALIVRVEHVMSTNDAVYCWTDIFENKIMEYAKSAGILHEIEELYHCQDSHVIEKVAEICADVSDWCLREHFKKLVSMYGSDYQSENGFLFCDGDLSKLVYPLRLVWFQKHLPVCVPYM